MFGGGSTDPGYLAVIEEILSRLEAGKSLRRGFCVPKKWTRLLQESTVLGQRPRSGAACSAATSSDNLASLRVPGCCLLSFNPHLPPAKLQPSPASLLIHRFTDEEYANSFRALRPSRTAAIRVESFNVAVACGALAYLGRRHRPRETEA
jgi:hypothetical protein